MEDRFVILQDFLVRVPGINPSIGYGEDEDGYWWAKFKIDIQHPLAWNVVQELGHLLNYMSINERLPTTFFPVSPPPYMNGGPGMFLSWVIETEDLDFTPALLVEWLTGRLPRPVDDLSQWQTDEG